MNHGEKLYAWLADQLDILVYECRQGESRVVSHVSPPLARTLGYACPELQHADAFTSLIHPEDQALASQALTWTREANRAARAEYRLVSRTGRVVWVREENVLARDADGQPVIRGYARDVTDERLAGDAIFESQSRIRVLAEQLPAVIWTTDAEANLTSILGRAASHLQLGVEDFPGDTTVEPHRRALAGERVAFEAEWNGRSFEAHVEPLQAGDGAIAGAIGIALDVTERKQAAARLRKSEELLATSRRMEALGRLAGGVAHDFNNLLTSILGNAHLLVESLDGGDPRRDEAERIKSVSQRGVALIEQLLAFARGQALEPRVLDINAVIAGMENMLSGLLGARLKLLLALHPDTLCVRIDPAALEQVVLNLVMNARDAMPGGGAVTIETQPSHSDEPRVELTISDTGAGMDATTKSRIFEPFFTTKARARGTGLGLATVYGIVEQSEGQIAVESEPGRGARFRITFPVADGPIDMPARAAGEAMQSTGEETILLVEDDDEVRALARKFLERTGYTVIEARSGEEAISAWRSASSQIDLLLTDIVLPGIDGIAMSTQLMEEGHKPRVLFMSGFIGEHGRDERLAGIGAPVLRKPFSPEALVREVRAALSDGSSP